MRSCVEVSASVPIRLASIERLPPVRKPVAVPFRFRGWCGMLYAGFLPIKTSTMLLADSLSFMFFGKLTGMVA